SRVQSVADGSTLRRGLRGWPLWSKRLDASLTFSFLFASHPAFDIVEGFCRVGHALRGGETEPFVGFNRVRRDGFAFVKAHTQIELCQRIALLGRLPIPLKGF